MNTDEFSDAIAGIYDAALDVDRWQGTLTAIGEMFGSEFAQIAIGAQDRPNEVFLRISGLSEDVFQALLPKYLELIPTDPRGPPPGAMRFKPWHCRQLVSDEELWASDMYKEVLSKIDMEYIMCFAVPFAEGAQGFFSVGRSRARGPFTLEECADYGRFVPHVTRALTIRRTLARDRQAAQTARAALDCLPLGMMMVEESDLVFANRAGHAMLKDGDAIRHGNGRLRASTAQADAQLRDALHEAVAGRDQPVGIALPSSEHDHPVRAVIRKLNTAAAGTLGGARDSSVAIYLTDPRRPIETPEELLQRLFGLTAREASVLRALVQGQDVQAIAQRLRISPQTVRVHLRSIMQTTGARRQVDLVRLVLASPTWIGASGTR